MKNCICKIYNNNGSKGTGFFCKIPFPDQNNLLPVLITNNHVLTQNDIAINNIIKITINNDKVVRNITINSKRKTFTSQNLDVTFIEISPSKDNINNFLEIDENINLEIDLLEYFYNKKSIYTLHYPKGKNIEVSYGLSSGIIDYNIGHSCVTDKGSSGCPILLLDSFKIIGIHKGAGKFKNMGTFMKDALKAFNIKFKNNYYKNISLDDYENQNEMTIIYSIGDYEFIRIFSKKFVENNRNNCKIIINEKEQEITEYINKYEINTKDNLLQVKLKEINTIFDMSYMFFECRRLIMITSMNWNTNKVTDMSYMFSSCLSLTYLSDLSKWKMNNVRSIKGMFELCISIPSLPDISNWNTSNIINMSLIFNKCTSLSILPDISKWDTNNVTDMSGIFNECSSLKSLPDISKWKTNKVVNMSSMFSKCSSLSNLPDISIWNTNNVANMSKMFNKCSSLENLPDISKWNINNVLNTNSMFDGCKKSLIIPKKFINY